MEYRKGCYIKAAVCAAVAGAVVLYLVDPVQVRWMPRCIFHSLTGWQCPSCGLMRATHAALHGHWHEALMYNLMLPVLLGLAAIIIARCLVRGTSGWSLTRLLVWLYLLIYCAWGVTRNLIGI